jgi:Kef-type K+ transport system membrane component KefB
VRALEPMKTDPSIAMLAELGVLVLLFEVGLESTVRQMMRVGMSSLAVAVLGVVTPFALGWGVAAWLLPEHSVYLHMFIGATLCATSVGITARVLKDLGESQSDEARIVLGAAVIDDVLGLVILAVVTGVVAAADSGGTMSYVSIGLILAKAVVFLFGALALGVVLSPRVLALAARLRAPGTARSSGSWARPASASRGSSSSSTAGLPRPARTSRGWKVSASPSASPSRSCPSSISSGRTSASRSSTASLRSSPRSSTA